MDFLTEKYQYEMNFMRIPKPFSKNDWGEEKMYVCILCSVYGRKSLLSIRVFVGKVQQGVVYPSEVDTCNTIKNK